MADHSDSEIAKQFLFDRYVSTLQSGPPAPGRGDLTLRNPYYDWIVETSLPRDREARILDLGAGYGAFLQEARRHGYVKCLGVERSVEMRARGDQLGVDGLITGDMFAFLEQESDARWDAVTLLDVVEHLRLPELLSLLRGVSRVLKPGGRVVIQTANGEGIYTGSVLWSDLTHEQAFTRVSLRQAFLACGFVDPSFVEIEPRSFGIKGLVRRLAWRLLVFPLRVLFYLETGDRGVILSRNLLARATKPLAL